MIIKKSTRTGFKYYDDVKKRFASKKSYIEQISDVAFVSDEGSTIIPYWELSAFTKENLNEINGGIYFIQANRKKKYFNNANDFKIFTRDLIREINDKNASISAGGEQVGSYIVIEVTYKINIDGSKTAVLQCFNFDWTLMENFSQKSD